MLISGDNETVSFLHEGPPTCSPTRPRVGIDGPRTGLRAAGAENSVSKSTPGSIIPNAREHRDHLGATGFQEAELT